MFVNEYVMTRRRYTKWATPKFWKLRSFYLWVIIFVAGIFGWFYFDQAPVTPRWKTIGVFLVFVAVYRGVCFPWMHADKTFRLTRQKYFNEKNWTCKVILGEKNISLYINGKSNNKVEWSEIVKLEEAKTYLKLTSKDGIEGVMLDKEAFTEGTSDSFIQWMKEKHPEIACTPIAPAFNK